LRAYESIAMEPPRYPQDDALTRYGLAGLARCWMPDLARWSHKYHLDGRAQPNESVPHSDVYYSLNVILGLARVVDAAPSGCADIASVFRALCETSLDLPVRNGIWGMAAWAACAHDLDLPGPVCDRLKAAAGDLRGWQAQDVGLSLTGACALAARDGAWRQPATILRDVLMREFRGPGALFRDGARGVRRHVATFATQVYAALALYHFGEAFGDEMALDAADACVTKLLALQGELGEWPWFYDPASECVTDRYEVYSVHQHGMAPALLHHAVERGVPGAEAGLRRGFEWLFGRNEMGISMLVPELSLVHRSQARRGMAGRREIRFMRALAAVISRQGGAAAGGAALRLTPEMRSYEFGWLLWSFSNRPAYADLAGRAAFAGSGQMQGN
jgi:hypothetical protein